MNCGAVFVHNIGPVLNLARQLRKFADFSGDCREAFSILSRMSRLNRRGRFGNLLRLAVDGFSKALAFWYISTAAGASVTRNNHPV